MNEKDEKLNKGSFLYINNQDKAEWGYPEGYPKKSVQTTTLMEEQEVEFTLEDGGYTAQLTNPFKIVEGQTYTANWDGTEYECVGTAFNNRGSVLGNLSIIGAGDDTGEPFIYSYAKSEAAGGFMTLDTAASHTISVKTMGKVITPMAPDFLPQANQTTYGAIKKAAHVPHVTAAPTSNDFNKLLSALREAEIMSQSE